MELCLNRNRAKENHFELHAVGYFDWVQVLQILASKEQSSQMANRNGTRLHIQIENSVVNCDTTAQLTAILSALEEWIKTMNILWCGVLVKTIVGL